MIFEEKVTVRFEKVSVRFENVAVRLEQVTLMLGKSPATTGGPGREFSLNPQPSALSLSLHPQHQHLASLPDRAVPPKVKKTLPCRKKRQ
jgi:hypothetical protein